ncbi:MAG: hypothetical protein K8953_02180 [Proteobacteria bacterium]|nr:hypothetical protein [Pseudomonadota bacterium]
MNKSASNENVAVKFIRTNLDEILILTSFLSLRVGAVAGETDEAVLAAFQRYSAETHDLESTQNYLSGLSDEQITGVVSGVKGILHEMEFVKIENTDGDSIAAAMFPETNHQGFDVVMSDAGTGESWELQLKTTDNQDYVQEWMSDYPDGEILVSQEIADELGLQSSGFSNEDLTVRVEDFVDELVSGGVASGLLNLFPTLALVSVAFVWVELYERYRAGDISKEDFVAIIVKATGVKVAKIALIMGLMAIPVVNVVVAVALIAKILHSLASSSNLPSVADMPKVLSKSDYLKPLNQISGRATA